MKTKIKELDIEVNLENYFHNKKDESFGISRQVYFGGKKIDMVLFSDGVVCSIEVKISDWKTALRQANLNRVGSDYSFVAMWHEDAGKAVDNIEEFVKNKVGLIIVDEHSEPFFFYSPRPKQNKRLLNISKNCLFASAAGMAV